MEIELLNYKVGDNFKGRVKLANLGWIPIDTTWIYANPGEFILNTYKMLGPVEYIDFYNIAITDNLMIGKYLESGPYIDTAPHDFTAIKK